MKKSFLLLIISITVVSFSAHAQTAAKKYVLFEHFTQASCGPCAAQNPAFQDNIMAKNEGNMHHIAYHTSWPGVDEMYDHNPTESDARVAYYNVTGVPDMYNDGATVGSPANVTQQMVDDALAAGSPIAIYVSEVDNGATRDVTVDIPTVGTSPAGNLVLRVAIVEHWINYANPPGSNGETDFPNVFRKMLTPMAGVTYTAAAQGSSVTFNYTYTEDGVWDATEIYVIAWVQNETNMTVLNSGSSIDPHASLSPNGPTFVEGANGTGSSFNGSAEMVLGGSENFDITLTNDAPGDWNSSFTVAGNTYTSTANISVTNGSPENIVINATPGATPAFSTYTLTITSTDNPQTMSQSLTFKLISGITDLVVNNASAYSDGVVYPWNDLYNNGLDYANNTKHDEMMISDFMDGFDQSAFGGVYNVYWNVGWSFPALTPEVSVSLKSFLDNGGNLLLAGQDIGWAAYDNTIPYGNADAQSFFTDYMEVQFANDGGPANNSYIAVAGDSIFGNVTTSTISDVYSPGNSYLFADELTPVGSNVIPIFNYTGGVKIGGIRIEMNGYKLVYLGAGLEHLNGAVADEIMKLSHDWFYSSISSSQFDLAMNNLMLGQNFPNPASTTTTILFDNLNLDVQFVVTNMLGQKVFEQNISAGTEFIRLDVSNFENGIYQYSILNNNQLMKSDKIEVIH